MCARLKRVCRLTEVNLSDKFRSPRKISTDLIEISELRLSCLIGVESKKRTSKVAGETAVSPVSSDQTGSALKSLDFFIASWLVTVCERALKKRPPVDFPDCFNLKACVGRWMAVWVHRTLISKGRSDGWRVCFKTKCSLRSFGCFSLESLSPLWLDRSSQFCFIISFSSPVHDCFHTRRFVHWSE